MSKLLQFASNTRNFGRSEKVLSNDYHYDKELETEKIRFQKEYESPVAGLIEENFGCRVVSILGAVLICFGLGASSFVHDLYLLYLTYGVIAGIGFCFCHVAANVAVNVHFDKRRALAAGITSTGNAVGTILLPIIGYYLIDIYTWRGTFLILAGIGLQGMYCGVMLPNKISSNKTIKSQNYKENQSKNHAKKPENERIEVNLCTKTRGILSNKKFSIFMFSGICVSLVYFVPFVMLPDMLIEKGMAKTRAVTMITVSGIASILSRIIFGFLSDFPWWNRMLVNGISLVILGISTSTLFIFQDEYMYFLYSALLGVVTGVFGMYQSVIVVDILGKETVGLAFGYLTLFEGLSVMIGPPIAGQLYDTTNDYGVSFIASGILFTIGGLLSIFGSKFCTERCRRECFTPYGYSHVTVYGRAYMPGGKASPLPEQEIIAIQVEAQGN
ncbi:hypothetical protein FSP39_008808 [Pinctada imbricata]|uniref:Major facilitator superfamily (MFS) profile domain-containing protein n=1 Tax=Pinctada imbricata TaxID=66713 RepID=A0AA88Y5H8_PINIB|nr:hypothetical protein FSP39_008808 [Pinctada imbricata]